MTINGVQVLVNEIMKKCGVNTPVQVTVNNRFSNVLGKALCKVDWRNRCTYDYRIQICGAYLRVAADEDLMQTVLHECAHIIDYARNPMQKHSHDYAFKCICAEIGCKENQAQHSHFVEMDWRYIVKCPDCGRTKGYMRQCGITKNPELYRCSHCSNNHGLKLIVNSHK